MLGDRDCKPGRAGIRRPTTAGTHLGDQPRPHVRLPERRVEGDRHSRRRADVHPDHAQTARRGRGTMVPVARGRAVRPARPAGRRRREACSVEEVADRCGRHRRRRIGWWWLGHASLCAGGGDRLGGEDELEGAAGARPVPLSGVARPGYGARTPPVVNLGRDRQRDGD
jgi:hypothetical protein